MPRSDREVLEDAVRVLAEQAADSDRIVEEALEAGLAAEDRVVVYTKMLRLELLNTKAASSRRGHRLGSPSPRQRVLIGA